MMSYSIVGLGNKGEEYQGTRHNTGRIIVDAFLKKEKLPPWKENLKHSALLSKGEIKGGKVTLMLPELLMNRSGVAVSEIVANAKKAEKLIVVYDDLDLGFGNYKISFGRSSGGHKGVESIIKHIKTRDFIRIRVGISPTTPTGKIKKPFGSKKVIDFIMQPFSKKETETLSKLSKTLVEVLETIVEEGKERAMNRYN